MQVGRSLIQVSVNTTGNPPALPGDFRSFRVPGVNESLSFGNRSTYQGKRLSMKHTQEVSCCLNTHISPQGVVRSDSAAGTKGSPDGPNEIAHLAPRNI